MFETVPCGYCGHDVRIVAGMCPRCGFLLPEPTKPAKAPVRRSVGR